MENDPLIHHFYDKIWDAFYCMSIFCKPFYSYIPVGHGIYGQLSESTVSPTHGAPPLTGVGLLHNLNLYRTPSPQDTVHSPHSDHNDHAPFKGGPEDE